MSIFWCYLVADFLSNLICSNFISVSIQPQKPLNCCVYLRVCLIYLKDIANDVST